jgi:ribosomal protein S12 methylthiotransferase accessory factor
MPTKGGGYTLPFNLAFARLPMVSSGNDDWACGRSLDPFVAYAKACAEAQEWGACSIAHGLITKDIDSLMKAITPESIVAFHSEQYASPNFPFSPFDTENMYEWKEAANIMTGETCYVLADCIYFPYYPKYPRYASANSSGAAAYPTKTGAIERGVLELVERDAFMIVWLNRLVMPSIHISSLPDTIQYRIQKLEEVGFKVRVKDLTLDLAPVVLIFVQNENLYYTTCSACSSFDITEAMDHALMEVEAAVYCRLSFDSSEPIFPEDVRMTQDHGKIYEQECFFCKADFFQESLFLKNFGEIGKGSCLNWEMLLERFTEQQRNILVVNLENPKIDDMQSDLYIVKTFVTGLVPISFGYMEEPCGMRRIYEIPVSLGLLSASLCYNDLNRFPHPYT